VSTTKNIYCSVQPPCFFGWLGVEIALRCTSLSPSLNTALPQSVEFVDRRGRPLRRVLQDQRVYRLRCKLSDISLNVIAATLSAEDKRFRVHSGIDFLAAGRALTQFLTKGAPQSGAIDDNRTARETGRASRTTDHHHEISRGLVGALPGTALEQRSRFWKST